jgi:hypothetical protein
VVSPLFNSARDPKSPELLALNDIRALWSAHLRGSPIIVAADTTPGIFALALERDTNSQELELRLPREWILAHPTVRLVECKIDGNIGTLQAKGLALGNSGETLEKYLFHAIRKAFEAHGCRVVEGVPSRYERQWVI